MDLHKWIPPQRFNIDAKKKAIFKAGTTLSQTIILGSHLFCFRGVAEAIWSPVQKTPGVFPVCLTDVTVWLEGFPLGKEEALTSLVIVQPLVLVARLGNHWKQDEFLFLGVGFWEQPYQA